MKNISFSVFFLLSLLFVSANISDAVPTCSAVAVSAAPCVGFVTGKAPMPARACCTGLQGLAKQATTVVARQAICRCLQQGVKNFVGVQDKFLSQIPGSCNIKVGFPVSLSTNCDKIK